MKNFRNIFIEAEIDRENTYFYELGIGYNTLGELYKVKDLPFAIGNDDTFNSIKIYGGFGKKIMLKNNLNLFNLQFGGSLGINLTSSGLSNLIDTYQVKNENGQSAIIKAYSSGTVAKIFPTVYVALSKDIRVTNNFYFCLTYRYDQGFVTTYQQKFEYFYINSSSDVKTVNNNITGTSHSLQFGFKYKFLPKKYK